MSRKRILIIRPDNIGDVVLFSGAILHIRNLYPDAHITLAVQLHVVNLVELCPYIDACVAYEQLTWWGRISTYRLPLIFRIEQAICRWNKLFNIVYSPFHTILYPVKSPQVRHLEIAACLSPVEMFGIIGCRLNVPERKYSPEINPEHLFTKALDASNADHWVHELDTTLDYLRLLGCSVTSVDDIKPVVWLPENEKNYLDGAVKAGKKIIGLFPGSSFSGKIWDSDNYGKLAGLLGGRQIYAIFGSPSDTHLTGSVARSIREHCPDAAILDFAGQTTLRELARTIMSCDLFISTDTSGLHMAISADIPTIGIVGGGHYGRFVPWGDPGIHKFLTHHMDCFYCNWFCTNDNGQECIKLVTPDEVAAVANKLLHPE